MGHLVTPRLPAYPITATSELSAAGRMLGAVLSCTERGATGLGEAPIPLSFSTRCGVVRDLPALPPELARYATRVGRIAYRGLEPVLDAVHQAVARWGASRVAVIIGTSTGAIAETEAAFAIWLATGALPAGYSLEAQHAFDGLVELLAGLTGAEGPRYAVSTACASSLKVFGAAQRLLAAGLADAVLVGGADSLCATTLRGFGGLRVLSAAACRPFDAARDGINIGEGAAFALIERTGAAGAPHLLAIGEGSDAHHMTAPHPEGLGAIEAMRAAIEGAGVDPAQVGYLHAHGTGTPLNDRVESDAVAAVFGTEMPVSSTKGVTGHLLGAAGALSAAVALEALRTARLPVNVGLTERDPEVRVRVVAKPERRSLERVLVNAFAFGGCNASLLVGQPIADPVAPPEREVHVLGASLWAPGLPTLEHLRAEARAETTEPEARLLGARARGRASPLTRMFAEVLGQLAETSRPDLASVPIVYASAYGEMATTLSLLETLATGDALLSPIRFQASVHNTAAGILSIQTGNRAFSTAIAAGHRTSAMALVEATAWLRAHGGEVLVAIADEQAPEPLSRGQTYPAFAAALHLAADERAGRSLGRLERLRVDALGGSDERRSEFARNPSAGVLALLDRIAAGSRGTVPLEWRRGEGYVVDFVSAEGSSAPA